MGMLGAMSASQSPSQTPSPGPLIGAHVSVSGGVANAFPRAAALGCEAIQIFVKNANRWSAKPLADEDIEAFRAARAEAEEAAGRPFPVAAHASYLINLAAEAPKVLQPSRRALIDELTRCAVLGVDGLVLHPGSHLGAGIEEGIERIAREADRALDASPPGPLLLFENTAGQGTNLGWELAQLAAMRDRMSAGDRVGFCLDTCHAFAAGYAVHEEEGYERFMDEVESYLGADHVRLIHCNDSAKPFGSRRDRHAHLGEGELGGEAFRRWVNEERFAGVGMVLETESGGPDGDGYRDDLALLRTQRAAC